MHRLELLKKNERRAPSRSPLGARHGNGSAAQAMLPRARRCPAAGGAAQQPAEPRGLRGADSSPGTGQGGTRWERGGSEQHSTGCEWGQENPGSARSCCAGARSFPTRAAQRLPETCSWTAICLSPRLCTCHFPSAFLPSLFLAFCNFFGVFAIFFSAVCRVLGFLLVGLGFFSIYFSLFYLPICGLGWVFLQFSCTLPAVIQRPNLGISTNRTELYTITTPKPAAVLPLNRLP